MYLLVEFLARDEKLWVLSVLCILYSCKKYENTGLEASKCAVAIFVFPPLVEIFAFFFKY
jgi:hypothetical protein